MVVVVDDCNGMVWGCFVDCIGLVDFEVGG